MTEPLLILDARGVIVDGDDDLRGLTVEQVQECVTALFDLARGRPQLPAMLNLLYRRGWVSADGSRTNKGLAFRDYWFRRRVVIVPGPDRTNRHASQEAAKKDPPPRS